MIPLLLNHGAIVILELIIIPLIIRLFPIFSSYSAMYNYIHGDQTAYISSVINQTGKDITMSIDSLGDDLGQN